MEGATKNKYTVFDMLSMYYSLQDKDMSISLFDEILEDWISSVVESEDLGLSKGLVGVGWFISFLHYKRHMKGNADEYLYDIDDLVYKLSLSAASEPSSDPEILLQYLTFYTQRLSCTGRNVDPYRFVLIFRIMDVIIERLNDILESDTNNATINVKVDILLKFSNILSLGIIRNKSIHKCFNNEIENAVKFLEKLSNPNRQLENISKLYLSCLQFKGAYSWKMRLQHLYSAANDSNLESNWRDVINRILDETTNVSNSLPIKDGKFLFQYVTNINLT